MNGFLYGLYRAGMRLYPAQFRNEYGGQILTTLRDAHKDRTSSLAFWFRAFIDLGGSVVREKLHSAKRMTPAGALGAAALASFVILFVAIVVQQTLRRSADRPQAAMIDICAARINSGDFSAPAGGPLDMATTTETFVIFYGPDDQPRWSTAQLNGRTPVPPAGIFGNLREQGGERFTWQPQRGVRVAAVAKAVKGGFLLSGRSLANTEVWENFARVAMISSWLVLMAFFGTLVFTKRDGNATASF